VRLVLVGGVLALACYGVACAAFSALLAGCWRGFLRRRAERLSSSDLLALRLAPAAAALLLVFGVFVPAWIRHEPLQADEPIGALGALASLAGLALLGHALARGASALAATRRRRRELMAGARSLELGAGIPSFAVRHAYPLACVMGFRRQELLLAESVLQGLERDQLVAVLEHERHHARGGDNLRGLLLRVAPDALAGGRVAGEIERAWAEASECEADAAAARGGRREALTLAAALVRVARLALPGQPVPWPAATLIGAGVLEVRVRRLLAPSGQPHAPLLSRARAGALVAGVVLSLALAWTGGAEVHRFIERGIAWLSPRS
jgi:hypothetical protein